MSKNKKTKTPHFKRKKIKYEEKDPIEELMDLYEEENIDGQQEPLESTEEKDHKKEGNDSTLKNLIEVDRTKRRKKFYLISLIVLVILAGSALAGFLTTAIF